MPRLLVPFLFFVWLFPILTLASEDPEHQPILDLSPPPVSANCIDNSVALHELDRANAKLHDLEKSLSAKDVILQEKLKIISSLQEESESLKKREGSDLVTVEKELGSKVVKLQDDINKAEIELQKYKSKVQTLESESKTQASKIKQLEKLVSEQKTRITKAERALRVAESTLVKVQQEVDIKDRELLKVNGGWLPPWIVAKSSHLKDTAVVFWIRNAQPTLDAAASKVSENADTVWKSSKPYVDHLKRNVQEKWSPVIKQSIASFKSTVNPHVEVATSKMVEGYESVVKFVSPKLEIAHNVIKPHLEAVNKTCKPYIEKVAGILHPYYKQVKSFTKPHRRKILKLYRRFHSPVAAYHSQLQISVQSTLKKYDVLAPLASKEVAWFMAAGLLLLPIMAISAFFSSIRSSPRKPVKAKKPRANHARGKTKRAMQADK